MLLLEHWWLWLVLVGAAVVGIALLGPWNTASELTDNAKF